MPTDDTQSRRAVDALAADWRAAGVAEGDMLLVHSSASRTLRRLKAMEVEADPKLIIDSLLQAVGLTGTLLLPLFNFDFTRGIPFDILSSPSSMGVLSETARQRQGVVRTGHPIYSFAALGARKDEFASVVNLSGYDDYSPFGILKRANGKIAILDLPDQNAMTFYHHVEHCEAVNYRFHKSWTGFYSDADGRTENRTFGLFVRDLERGVTTHVDPMGERLWDMGLYSGDRPRQGSGLRVIGARALYDATRDVIRLGEAEGLLYKIELP